MIIHSTTQQDILDYLAEVATDRGYPIVKKPGKQATERWDIAHKAHEQNIWWCEKEPNIASSLDTRATPDLTWYPPSEI